MSAGGSTRTGDAAPARILDVDEPSKLRAFVEIERGIEDRRRVFTVRSDRVQSGATGAPMLVDRLACPNWVNVIPVVDDTILCVRQWRFGAHKFTLEIPAGVADANEDPRTTALRELREETGHAPVSDDDVVSLGSVLPNAAFLENRMHSFLVKRAVCVGPLSLDAHEEIEVVRVPLRRIDALIDDGTFENAMGLVALLKFRLSAHWPLV